MAHSGEVTKAVVPVAGLGTRFLPATKVTPKAMMPVVDKPTIQYVVEEAVSAGLDDVLLVTSEGQQSIAEHFGRAYDLEARLKARKNERALAEVIAPTVLASVSYVRQDAPRGLGHAVLCGAEHVGDEPFAVMLGDDLIDRKDDLLARMLAARSQYGGSIVALMEVPASQTSAYGVAAFKPTDDPDIVAITDLIEKPAEGEAPSNWIVIGRYVCDPQVFSVLRTTSPGRGGEIQLTDALRTLAIADRDSCSDGGGVHGVLFRGRRYDTGNKQDFLRTTVEFACSRPDLADEFIPWLREYLGKLP
ncbi:MAG TPA: UTP--glucose-1-phosphate uridylyltransferase [Streptosporangiaceae bacterium]|jgi:UTP--glucose-1-phosphate uridylyltransferase|nr:UTP--glucose-1-phosphate uridylyltransferase [Streptosporangiaceae bacterium]